MKSVAGAFLAILLYATVAHADPIQGGTSASSFYLATFAENTEVCRTLSSNDGVNFTNLPFNYMPIHPYCRDPKPALLNGTYYIFHSDGTLVGCCTTKIQDFAIASSSDGINYKPLISPNFATSNPTISAIYAPNPFQDGPTTWVTVAASNHWPWDATGFQAYITKPTILGNLSGTWDPLTLLAITGESNLMDVQMVKVKGAYYLWYKKGNSPDSVIQVAKCSTCKKSPIGTYTDIHIGDWMGIGQGVEGTNVYQLPNGIWRLVYDPYIADTGLRYVDQISGDWTTRGATKWTASAPLTGQSPPLKHGGTIILPGGPP